LHSSPADIETVIIDGIARKQNGTLLPVSVDGGAREVTGTTSLEWSAIAREVVKSRAIIQTETEKVDVAAGLSALMKMWHVDESLLVD
jgi:hypothetical protein